MTTRMITVVAILSVIVTSHIGFIAGDPAPQGCHQESISELNEELPVPGGWLFKRASAGEILAYEVRPAGPGFEGLRALYRLEVRRGTSTTVS